MAVETESNDVIIIGGGIAGLSCAVSLLRLGRSVALVEWQERLGGRLCTVALGDLQADTGAAWVHGIEGNPLIEDGWIGPEDLVTSSAQNLWLHGPAATESCSFQASEGDARWERRLATVGAAKGQGGRSLQDGLQETEPALGPLCPAERRRLRMLEGWFGMSADRIGLLEWDGEHGSMGDYPGAHAILKGGTQILVQRLSDEAQRLGLKVFLGQEVCAVEESGEKCLVHCQKGGRFQAKCVVLTVSLGVLQSRPGLLPLPEKPLQRLEMCRYNKLLLRVSESVAGRFPVFTDLDSEVFWQLFNYWPLTGKPVLSLATLAPQAEDLTDEEALEVASKLLTLAPDEISASHFTRWGQVPWSCGSYSVSSKDAEWDDIRALVQWTEGKRVKLAGEHTHEEHQGGFHAAYLSGKRAAQEVLEFDV